MSYLPFISRGCVLEAPAEVCAARPLGHQTTHPLQQEAVADPLCRTVSLAAPVLPWSAAQGLANAPLVPGQSWCRLIPAGLFFFGLIFIRESPRWLVTKGKMEKARANLSYLRKLPEGHQYVEEEISAVQEQYEHEISIVGEGFFASMWEFKRNTVLLKRLFITTTLFLFQNGTGVVSCEKAR